MKLIFLSINFGAKLLGFQFQLSSLPACGPGQLLDRFYYSLFILYIKLLLCKSLCLLSPDWTQNGAVTEHHVFCAVKGKCS